MEVRNAKVPNQSRHKSGSLGDYKLTDVGLIPREWDVFPIGKLGDVQGGRQRSPRAVGAPTRYLRVANVFDGFIDASDVLEMPFTAEEKRRFLLRDGDILLNEGQSLELVGRSAIYRGLPADCCFQNTLVRFRANDRIAIQYAQLLFQKYLHTGVFASIAMQTTSIAHLGAGRFAALQMAVPSRIEQHAIAEALSDADVLIESLSLLLAKKRHIKQGAMQELLTGKKRLPGFRGEWQRYEIGEIAAVSNERKLDSQPLPVLACSKHLGFVDSIGFFKNQVFSRDTGNYKIVRRGQIGYPANHIEEGSIGLQDLYDAALVSPIYVVFSLVENFDSYFLHRLLKLDEYRQRFEAATSSSVDRRGSLRWPVFSKIAVTLPNYDEQCAVREALWAIEAEISALESKLAKARQLRQAMMQELLPGRIRLVQPTSKVIPLPIVAAATKSSSDKPAHNWQINEAVVIGVLAQRFGTGKFPLPRKRRVKLMYLLHRHSEGRAEGYLKKAAGPYDPNTKYKGPEAIALKNGYVRALNNGTYEGFVAGAKADQALGYFEQWYGAAALTWLEQFRYRKTDDLELLATVDMAMVDLAAAGQPPDLAGVERVIAAHPEWVPKLSRELFSNDNIANAVAECRALFAD